MEITDATPEDAETIRDVAGRSMEASYAVSPDTLEAILNEQFDPDRLSDAIDSEGSVLLVAREDGEVGGFVEAEIDDGTGTLTWLHVATEFRGMGMGSGLFEAARERLHDEGVSSVRARELADNAEGQGFFEYFGFEKADQQRIEIAGEDLVVEIYAESESEVAGEDETDSAPQETVETDDGTVYVDRSEELAGEDGPFFVAYSDESYEDPYGYYCGNCESLVEAVDSMDRIECGTCGNLNKPDEWDGGYL
ncbi:GNAT family N-acetyltransferase [Halalkalicoccus sp. NIPERK01]|uniref:GNAT family N-acetyltransferase n=1 Tax=Halalkalicoccus sp. NIPERK01 TaxID=3053469 RepID=UPI00256F64FD|nr:GNAT family N-acetyltransferase [Halalkalicoccus sp. NIPERK01]MDL5362199.1 GNAT family N-acetyltransferase [Halalkalicoccus sp. NIPERK01]